MLFLRKSHLLHPRFISYAACILFSYSLLAVCGGTSLPTTNGDDGILHAVGTPSVDVAPPKPDGRDVTSTSFHHHNHHRHQSQHHHKTTTGPEPPVNPTKIWAVLVAGSNDYYNYRHQVRMIRRKSPRYSFELYVIFRKKTENINFRFYI